MEKSLGPLAFYTRRCYSRILMARLSIVQGDTAVLRITILDAAGSPFDLTDVDDIIFTIKRSTQDSDAAAVFQGTKTGADIVIVGTDVEGIVDVTVPAEKTEPMRMGKPYYWDVQIRDADGKTFTPCLGTIFVETELTRS